MDNRVYDIVADEIIKNLGNGQWNQNWSTFEHRNGMTGRQYSGLNCLLLSFSGHQSNLWLTFNQIQLIGGFIKKGSKSVLITYYRTVEKKSGEEGDCTNNIKEEKDHYWLFRYYRVFNIECIKNIDEIKHKLKFDTESDNRRLIKPESIVENYTDKPEILYQGNQPCYRPTSDQVVIPPISHFKSSETFYRSLFHELSHSTGHKNRLDRLQHYETLNNTFNMDYAYEELIAEFSSAFLANTADIFDHELLKNSSGYINHWRKKSKKNLVQAVSKACDSANYILGAKKS